jgi:hypothetical protein
VVFFDDRPLSEGVRVCGLPVRNVEEDLEKLQREWKLDTVLLPPREGQPDARKTLGSRFQEAGLELCTLDWNLRRWTRPDRDLETLPQTMLARLSPVGEAVSAETRS